MLSAGSVIDCVQVASAARDFQIRGDALKPILFELLKPPRRLITPTSQRLNLRAHGGVRFEADELSNDPPAKPRGLCL